MQNVLLSLSAGASVLKSVIGSFVLCKPLQTLVCQTLLLLHEVELLKLPSDFSVCSPTDERGCGCCLRFTAHILCVCRVFLSVIPHPQNSWNRVSLVIPPPPPPTPCPCTCFLFFLFLVRVKSGIASVFHHRNRHNRPSQPSSGSANRDQIKSIIPLVCAKAFFLLPLSLLEALAPYFRAVPAGTRRELGLNKVLNIDVIRQVAC